MEGYLATCGPEPRLIHLLKLRVSQMYGCAYCIDMHWKDLRAGGEGEQRGEELPIEHDVVPHSADLLPGQLEVGPFGDFDQVFGGAFLSVPRRT